MTGSWRDVIEKVDEKQRRGERGKGRMWRDVGEGLGKNCQGLGKGLKHDELYSSDGKAIREMKIRQVDFPRKLGRLVERCKNK